MEHVLRYFMQLAEEETQRSIDAAAAQIDTSLASLLDFEDLEAEETPESLMLSTIGGSSDSKKRIERQLITPTLKFLWETFRTVLEILRNNTKLEDLYRDTALRAFAFCSKYKRSAEFRRLCDILRNHIQSQTKYDPKWKDREPPTPESLQAHLETRFAQLGTATDMELWQEAYRTVEDVHSLVMTMKKQPRPASMAAYHAQLAKIFWVADNGLFHAYATSRLFSITRTMKAHQDPAELQLLASRAVVAALAIPPVNPVLDVNLLEYDLEHEKTKRMAVRAAPSAAPRAAPLPPPPLTHTPPPPLPLPSPPSTPSSAPLSPPPLPLLAPTLPPPAPYTLPHRHLPPPTAVRDRHSRPLPPPTHPGPRLPARSQPRAVSQSMLAFPTNASRVELLDDIRSKGLLTLALPEVRQLHDMMENAFVPLDLSAQAAPLLQVLQEMGEPLAQYDLALRRLVALRVLQQMERVYLTIRIDHVGRAITLLPWAELETLILWAVKRELLTMRIDYKNGTINQRRAKADATASNEVREKLSRFASSLEAVSERLHAVDIERRKAEARARLYGSIDAGVEEEHQKILSRRLVIERRKEEQERVMMEEEKERARVKAIKQREEEAEEKARLASEAQRRDVERLQKERDEEEAAQMRKLAEQVAEQRKEMKVTKKKGQDPSTKVETDVDKLLTKDKKELLREQQALMMDERSEFEKRLESMAKRHDHMERARRQEERALLLLAFDDEQAADRAAHEARTEELKAQMRETREHDLAEKKRFARMGAAVKDFTERMLSARAVAHEAVVEAWREEQARLREEARKEAERIEAEERARERALEAARRAAEAEEARRIQASQEAQRKKREEEEERLRVQEKQKQREKEMEEKARQAEDQRRLDRLAERQKAGTAWGEEDTEEPSLPQLRARGNGDAAAKEEAGAAAKEAAAGAGGWTRAPERRDRPAPSDRWEQHRMGEDRPVGTRHEEEPRHGGDRREARRDRPPPPRDGPGAPRLLEAMRPAALAHRHRPPPPCPLLIHIIGCDRRRHGRRRRPLVSRAA